VTYKGEGVSFWLSRIDRDPEAKLAMRYFRASAMPLVQRWLDPPVDSPISEWTRLIPFGKGKSRQAARHLHAQRRFKALLACDALGRDAEAALPALSKLVATNIPEPIAAYELARIGTEPALAALAHCATNAWPEARAVALEALRLAHECPDIIYATNGPYAGFYDRLAAFEQSIQSLRWLGAVPWGDPADAVLLKPAQTTNY